jgi:hypothetical protein
LILLVSIDWLKDNLQSTRLILDASQQVNQANVSPGAEIQIQGAPFLTSKMILVTVQSFA